METMCAILLQAKLISQTAHTHLPNVSQVINKMILTTFQEEHSLIGKKSPVNL